MTQQFTASEVRDWERAYKGTGAAKVFGAFADLLEAQEKAVPVAWWNKRTGQILRPHELDAIPDAPHPHSYFKNGFVPLTAHSAQAQPPAASVTDAMVERAFDKLLADGLDDLDRPKIEGMRAALEAALAAQENPNG